MVQNLDYGGQGVNLYLGQVPQVGTEQKSSACTVYEQ